MKNRDLKALIRRTADREMPEIIDRIDLTTVEVIPPSHKQVRSWRWETVVRFAVVLLFMGFTSVLVYDLLTTEPEPNPTALQSDAELVGFPIVSAASFLGSLEPTDLSLIPLAMPLDTGDPLIFDQLDEISAYLGIMESLLGPADDIGFTALTSDREEYQYRLSYSATDLLGNAIHYEIYYNQTPSSGSSDQTDVVGILIGDSQQFTLSGRITQNANGIKTRFQATNQTGDYIIVEDKSTKQIQKYDYSYYRNDALVQSHSLRLMVESDQITALVEYADAENQISYRFQKETAAGQEEKIRIRYSCRNHQGNMERESGDITVEIGQNPLTQAYEYRYFVRARQGNQTSDHECTGKRNGLSSFTPGNDEPADDEPGNDTPGSDNPGPNDPGKKDSGKNGHGPSCQGHSQADRLILPDENHSLSSL
jgi:hypothetical protein